MSRAFKYALLLGVLAVLAVVIALRLEQFVPLDFWLSTRLEVGLDQGILVEEAMLVLLLLLGFGTALATVNIASWTLRLLVVVVLVMEIWFATWLLAYFEWYFSPFAPTATVLLAFLGGTIFGLTRVGARKRLATMFYGRRLSPDCLHRLVESSEPLPPEPQLADASVLVAEVVVHPETPGGEPSLAESVRAINRWLESASQQLLRAGACLEQCDGEGIRAVFGLPLPEDGHALRACQAGQELVARAARLNAESGVNGGVILEVRVAVHSDRVMLAGYGPKGLHAPGVGGEAVDFARVLCQLAARYGARLVVGGSTFEQVKEWMEVRPVDLLAERESGLPTEIYEVIGRKGEVSSVELKRRDRFWDGVILLREGLLEEARAAFLEAKPAGDHDVLVEFYLRRVEQLRNGMGRQMAYPDTGFAYPDRKPEPTTDLQAALKSTGNHGG